MHLIATNTSVWLRTLINEIMFEYEHFAHHYDPHDDDHANDTHGQYQPLQYRSRSCPSLPPIVFTLSLELVDFRPYFRTFMGHDRSSSPSEIDSQPYRSGLKVNAEVCVQHEYISAAASVAEC